MVWPNSTVSNYQEMLRKLSASAFFVTLGCMWIVRSYITTFDQFIRGFEAQTEIIIQYGFHVPFANFVVAIVIAFLSESIKLYDKISDLLRIRAEFDVYRILIPMALLSESTVVASQYGRITGDRRRLMSEVFYKYASSSKAPEIDKHLIVQALTAWSWYWFCAESIAIIIGTAEVLAYFSQWKMSMLMLALVLFLQILTRIFRGEAHKYTEAEISEILSDKARRHAVKSVFDAL
jgi:hypothetical protein